MQSSFFIYFFPEVFVILITRGSGPLRLEMTLNIVRSNRILQIGIQISCEISLVWFIITCI